MIRRALVALLLAAVALVLMVGVEILLALRREYLPTTPVLDVTASFGPSDGEAIRFAVLGDSTAAGVGVGTAELAYPTVLARRLAEGGRRIELRTFGVAGARVHDVLELQVPEVEAWQPDLIFIGIGANDVTHLTRLGDVERAMGETLDRLEETGASIVVAGAPDMGAAAFHEPLRSLARWRGRRVADAVAAAAVGREIPVVPLAAETGEFFRADPARYLSEDLFHPSAAGYEKWADAIEPYLDRVLDARLSSP